jgi:hypothetical protein
MELQGTYLAPTILFFYFWLALLFRLALQESSVFGYYGMQVLNLSPFSE